MGEKINLQIYLKPLLCSLIFTLCRARILFQYSQNYTAAQNNLSADCIVYCKGLDVKTRSSDKPMKTHPKPVFFPTVQGTENGLKTANMAENNFGEYSMYIETEPTAAKLYLSVKTQSRSVNWCHE